MGSVLLPLALLLCFGAPWTWLLYQRSQERTLVALLERVCLGYAISFALLFVASQFRLWLFAPIWLAGALIALVGFKSRRSLELGPEGRVVLGCALPYLALRSVPVWLHKLPIGWDAYFHMTLVESIVARGRAIHDWLPYEEMPLNYPIGAHLWLAFTQWLTGVRPHVFFDPTLVVFTLLTGLQLFALGSRASGDRRVGCFATLSYLFWANLGSYGYVVWSGLPNLIGMYLFLGLLTSLCTDTGTLRSQTASFAVYFLAACFVHHHVMVTAGLCLVWTTCARFVRGEREGARRIARGLIAAATLGAPYFATYLWRTRGLGDTEITNYVERAANALSIASDLGFGFALAAAAGVYLYLRSGERLSALVTQPLAAMLGAYITVEFLVRTGSAVLFHREIAPFTPSRFLTDAVPLLAIFAGLCFRNMQRSSTGIRPALALVIALGFFVFNRVPYQASLRDTIPAAHRELYEWVRIHADPDAVLLDPDWHASYLAQRMSSGFPLPTSEFSALAKRRQLLRQVEAGKQQPADLGRQVLAIVRPRRGAPEGRVLWERSGFRVVERYAPVRKF